MQDLSVILVYEAPLTIRSVLYKTALRLLSEHSKVSSSYEQDYRVLI